MAKTRRRRFWEKDRGSKTPLRVLVVEDSADDTVLLLHELARGGYEPYHERVETPEAMRDALDEGYWDVVVADHEMPRFSAPAALGILQERDLDLPFIIVSGQIGEDAAVAAMRAGAHDYVMKGNLARLCPAIERELREAAERRERRRREAALRQSEELYRAVVEQSSECIFLVDTRSRRVLEANNAFRELLGYAPEELRRITLYDFVAHDRESVDEKTRLVVEKGRHDIGERRYRRKDGTLLDVEVRANTLLLDGREVMCCVSHDITERKRAEEEIRTRARQQSAVADLGRRALASADLTTVMDEAVALVTHALGADYCEVLELLPEGDELLLRAGAGWEEGFVGEATVSSDSQAGYTLSSGSPVLVENLRTETRFEGHALLREHGVVSGISVIIQGTERPFGVLGAHTKEKRAFTGDGVNFLRAVANVLSAAIERKRAEERLSEIKESERRRIAADLHDEVLQDMVYGLQEIQIAQLAARRDGDPNTTLEAIADALQRSVEGLREAIFELHLEENLERSIVSSIESLVELNRRMSRKRYEVRLTVEDGFPEALPTTTAGRSLVRIVQEGLNNARRHSGAKNIWVSLKMDDDDVLRVEVIDDGRGFDTGRARGGVGTSAMRQRTLDLGGELEIQSKPGAGTVVRFRGPADRLLED